MTRCYGTANHLICTSHLDDLSLGYNDESHIYGSHMADCTSYTVCMGGE